MNQEVSQRAIVNSASFSSIATDAQGVIQIFNVGAEQMLGFSAAEVMNKLTPADISDPQELIARAQALSVELGTPITPGFDALVFKASRGIKDIYELTYLRKDGSRFPAVVSVTALRDAQDAIIGYLLIVTDNTARQQAEDALLKAWALQGALFNSAKFSSISADAQSVIQAPVPVALNNAVKPDASNWPRLPIADRLPVPKSSAERWACLVLRGCDSDTDFKTLRTWAAFVGTSYSGLTECCRMVKVQPHQARDLTRILRLLFHTNGRLADLATAIDIVDDRTLRSLLHRAGLAFRTADTTLSVNEFLGSQRFLQPSQSALTTITAMLNSLRIVLVPIAQVLLGA